MLNADVDSLALRNLVRWVVPDSGKQRNTT